MRSLRDEAYFRERELAKQNARRFARERSEQLGSAIALLRLRLLERIEQEQLGEETISPEPHPRR